ncbi:hypothetical protein GOA58_32240, partial [Sinorhizobium meliloti]|nr:hypothetical protein [Sinorhizobium meliloti]MDW9665029.1 hypothetical protein [Sinorhizobium meliloti]MDX0054840.1 hypothetical protein [Sinorhizobium meliloti]
RGRLFLGIGGRDHFGTRGRIASEFAFESAAHHLCERRRQVTDEVRLGAIAA